MKADFLKLVIVVVIVQESDAQAASGDPRGATLAERLLRGGGGRGGGGGGGGGGRAYGSGGGYVYHSHTTHYGGGGGGGGRNFLPIFGAIFMLGVVGVCIYCICVKAQNEFYDGEAAAYQGKASRCRAVGHNLTRLSGIMMEMRGGYGGDQYRISWICDMCNCEIFDKHAPLGRCDFCDVDFCQSCMLYHSPPGFTQDARTPIIQQPGFTPVVELPTVFAQPVLPVAQAQPIIAQAVPVAQAQPIIAQAVPVAQAQPVVVQASAPPAAIAQAFQAAPEPAPVWKPGAICDGASATDRAQYLVAVKGMTESEARIQVMSEFPAEFKY